MKTDVILSIRTVQSYPERDSETQNLTTDGTMEFRDGCWHIAYEESELTGLDGVTTTFQVEPDKITLKREGSLNSTMVFQEGLAHDSLYELPFGALLMTVKAVSVNFDLVPDGGMIDLVYSISIENSDPGEIDYHLDIRAKK